MHRFTLTIDHDYDTESPLEGDLSVKMVRFDRWGKTPNDYPMTIGLRRQFKCQTVFVLSKHEHSGECWWVYGDHKYEHLRAPGMAWDTTDIAGLLFLDSKTYPRGKRRECADSIIEEYNKWARGDCWWYCIEAQEALGVGDPELPGMEAVPVDPLPYDSCGGFIGWSHFMGEVTQVIEYLQRKYPGSTFHIAQPARWGSKPYWWNAAKDQLVGVVEFDEEEEE